ncbi:MAG: hypothetical protein IPO81_11315 [Kouleothrix sp.]|nr:hypothetical protein [Kouleothrix sp.]
MFCRRWLLALEVPPGEDDYDRSYRLRLQNLDDETQSFQVGTLEELLAVLMGDWERASTSSDPRLPTAGWNAEG